MVSIRFIYTSDIYILPPLIYLLQYTLLDNINLLLSNLSNNNEISFDQNSLNELKSAITYMELFTDSEPLWYQKSHHRIHKISNFCKNYGEMSGNSDENSKKLIVKNGMKPLNKVNKSEYIKNVPFYGRSDNFTVSNHIELNVMNADRNKMTNIVEKDSGVIDDIEDNLNKI